MARRYFQYLAGERKGEIVEFDKIIEDEDMIFVAFKDGSRCNEELILPLNERNWSTQLMAEVSDPSNVWRFKEEWVGRQEEKWAENADGMKVCVSPFIKGRKKVTPIPPKPVKSRFGEVAQSKAPETAGNTQSEFEPIKQNQKMINDPVWLMMDKAKKFPTDISMNINISLPSQSLYGVAKESFDEGGDKVIEYIISNMDNAKIKEALKNALKDAYEDDAHEDNTKEDVYIESNANTTAAGVSTYSYEPDVVEEPVVGIPKAASKEELENWKEQKIITNDE